LISEEILSSEKEVYAMELVGQLVRAYSGKE
jgi:hypothetical protein